MADIFDQIHAAASSAAPPPIGDVFDHIHSGGAGQDPDSFGNALREYGRKMNPLALGQAINDAVTSPRATAKGYGAQNESLADQAVKSFREGDYTGAARHSIAYLLNGIPGLGAAIDEVGNKLRDGKPKEATADMAALVSQLYLGAKAPEILNGAGAAASNTPDAISALRQKLGTAVSATGAAVRAAAPDLIEGAAKGIAGEALGSVPLVGTPARVFLDLGGAKQVKAGITKGIAAARNAAAPAAPPVPETAPQPVANGPLRPPLTEPNPPAPDIPEPQIPSRFTGPVRPPYGQPIPTESAETAIPFGQPGTRGFRMPAKPPKSSASQPITVHSPAEIAQQMQSVSQMSPAEVGKLSPAEVAARLKAEMEQNGWTGEAPPEQPENPKVVSIKQGNAQAKGETLGKLLREDGIDSEMAAQIPDGTKGAVAIARGETPGWGDLIDHYVKAGKLPKGFTAPNLSKPEVLFYLQKLERASGQ